jgi:quinol-cytochrome oxidoreductase complex cytochrome b subunit
MAGSRTTTLRGGRRTIRSVANNLILHLHPAKVPAGALRFTYTWGLGGISALLGTLLALTGILLMFRYDASVEGAFISIQALEAEVAFGSFVRAVHHWSANLLVITTFLHLLRVFFTGGYKKGRYANWLIGIGLFLIVLMFNFTGYLLPWDQLAYWAITVSTSLIAYLPIIGQTLSRFILAGPEVGQAALRNFYGLHVAILPVLLVAMMAYHFWKVRKNGGISQPENLKSTARERQPTIPNLVSREYAVGATVVAIIVIWGMLVPAPLEEMANPLQSPNPAKAAWYFLGLQELLLHMDVLAAVVLVLSGLVALILLPRWDRTEADIGVYFRSPVGRRTALVGGLLGLDLIPLLVVVDEYWLDLPALLPSWPLAVSNGILPLLLTYLGFALLYLLFRKWLKAGHSEALLGLFTFILTGLVVLTLIGIYFRGPNMALVFPFSF